MTTYEIIETLKTVEKMRNEVDENGEYIYTEEEVAEVEKQINATKEQKLNAIQDYKLSLNDEITRFEEKKAKQDANIKRATTQQEYLKDLQCELLDGEKLKTDEYTFSYRKSKSVNITDEERVLERGAYTKIKKEVDKTAIKKAIENGEKVLGAELVEKTSLSIR